jgi:protein disulfide-isomerase
MKRLMIAVVAGVLVGSTAGTSLAKLWETDYAKAAAQAKAANRYMVLDFSGSDWCGWCIRLEKEVFSKKAFDRFSRENLVCVLVDFPRGRQLKKSLRAQNDELKKKYAIRGFPTVLVLSPNGDLVGRTGYKEGGPDGYIAHLKGMIDPHRKKHSIPDPTSLKMISTRQNQPSSLRRSVPARIAVDENREMRTWHSRSGAELTASLLQEAGTTIVLKKEDGSTFRIRPSDLSEADRDYIAGLRTAAQEKAQ